MVGVMLSYVALDVWHLPQTLSVLVCVVGVVILGLFEEVTIIRPFLKRPQESIGWFIATLGFSVVIETVARIAYGTRSVAAIPSGLPEGPIRLGGGVSISPAQLLVIVALVVLTIALELFYRRTWIGLAMRATAQNRELSAVLGIRPRVVSLLALGISGVLGGLSGYVIAPIVGSDTTVGLTYALSGFIALAIGGFGSIRGAFVGALVLGVAEQLFALHSNATYLVVADLALLMIILVVRPTGLFRVHAARRV
jgi:branched-chain amino acid transport system permease protein